MVVVSLSAWKVMLVLALELLQLVEVVSGNGDGRLGAAGVTASSHVSNKQTKL